MRRPKKDQSGTKELRRVDGNQERQFDLKIDLNSDEILCSTFTARYRGCGAVRNVVVKPSSYDCCLRYDSRSRSSIKRNVMRSPMHMPPPRKSETGNLKDMDTSFCFRRPHQ
jgi:hypothetical protein